MSVYHRIAVENERTYHSGQDTGNHSPEITVPVKTPPVPFQQVGCNISAIQSRRDPLQDGVYALHEETDHHTDNNHRYRYDIAGTDHRLVAGIRVDIFFIDIIYNISRRRVGRRGKSRHKGSKQSGKQQSAYSNGHELVNSIRQDQFEVDRSGL